MVIQSASAETNVCVLPTLASPTLTSNVVAVALEIVNHLPLTGSVARGYVPWFPPGILALAIPTLTVIVPPDWSTAVIANGVLYAGSVALGYP